MDAYLRAWTDRVKPGLGRPARAWLFTDATRQADVLALIARLPRGRCGVVLRDDALPGRDELARAIARACRERRLALAVAGDWRLAARLGAGLHLRAGRAPRHAPRRLRALTASAHRPDEVVRAHRRGVALVFISPLFATGSHPGAPALGPVRWRRLAALAPGRAAALGGVFGRRVRAVPAGCRAIGGIEGFGVP